jgi:hypothetical protein
MTTLAPTLQGFFTDRLIRQRRASTHTVAAYRDTLRMLLCYAAERTGSPPSVLDLADLDASLISAFLITSRPAGTTPYGPATPGSPRFIRSSATPHCSTPNTPPASPAFWRSHRNASTGP